MSTFDYKEKHTKAELIESVVLSVESNLGHVEIASESSPKENSPTESQNILDSCETPPSLGPRYDILGLVGTGGMGTVWKVHDKELDEDFAIKVLKPELVTDETALKRFQKEANLASELTHANIAAIFGPGEDGAGRPYIIMRYVDGESLADILKREGKLSEERAMDIFSQLCEALSHSHMKGIIHRDIKPSNIIISKTESGADLVQLVDFGIARCVYDEVTKTQALTKAVDVFGSPRYMSPEQLLGEEVTAQSDIYSLGIVLFEMLTGEPPFADENPVALIISQLTTLPSMASVPSKYQTPLTLCLLKKAEARPNGIDKITKLFNQKSSIPTDAALPSERFELLAVILPVFLVFFPTFFSDIGTPLLPSIIGECCLLTAVALASENRFHKISVPILKRVEYILFSCGLCTLFMQVVAGYLSAFLFGSTKPEMHDSLAFTLSTAIIATAATLSMYNSKRHFSIFENLIVLIDKYAAGTEYRYSNAGKLLINSFFLLGSLYVSMLFGVTTAVIFSLLPTSGFSLAPFQSFLCFNLSLSAYAMSAILVLLAAFKKMSFFNFLPKQSNLLKSFSLSSIFCIVLALCAINYTTDIGMVDGLYAAVRNNSRIYVTFTEFFKYKPSHPSTYFGALAILRAHTTSKDNTVNRATYRAVAQENKDPLLRAAAELLCIDDNAFGLHGRVIGDPPTKLSGSLEPVFMHLQEPNTRHRYTAKEGIANTVLFASHLELKPFTKQEILRAVIEVAEDCEDSRSIRRAVALLSTISEEERMDNFDWKVANWLNKAKEIDRKAIEGERK